jgi:hypothetical protein
MTANPLPARKLSVFLLLSAADLGLTWVLLQNDLGQCYESNPVARWVLATSGWWGLIAFKGAVVVLVAGLTVLIGRSRPRAAGRVLAFGCSAVAVVLVYSGSLLCFLASPRNAEGADFRAVKQEAAAFQEQLGCVNDRRQLLDGLCDDLLAHRRSLTDAARALARSERACTGPWLPQLRERFPDYSKEECLAARLVEGSVVQMREDNARAAQRVAHRLQEEFQTSYGKPAPPLDCRRLAGARPAASQAG